MFSVLVKCDLVQEEEKFSIFSEKIKNEPSCPFFIDYNYLIVYYLLSNYYYLRLAIFFRTLLQSDSPSWLVLVPGDRRGLKSLQ